MYVHLLKEFQQSKSATAWVASILYCVSLLLGPVASTLTVRFGLRKVTIAAGLVTTAGFLASALAPSLWVLYFTFGVVVGAGFAVCDVTASVAVAYYFRKRRALATGLSECGTGIGTFAFPPLCEALVDTYGWRGAFVLMGGIALHVTVCGALFRPLDAFDRLAGSPVVWILRLLAQSRSVTLRRLNKLFQEGTPIWVCLPVATMSMPLLPDPDVIFRHCTSLPMTASCPELHFGRADSVSDQTSSQKYSVCLSKAKDLLKAAFDKEILRHSPFLLFTASNFLMYFWGDVPYLFANDFALERGVPDTQASFLISIIGIVNTVGQVIYGVIGDTSCNLTVVFGVSVVASGVVVVLLPFAESYWFMAVLCGLYGFFDAACYALITAILVSYVGLDKLAHAYGLVMMGKGLANLGGPPVAGWLTDETSYTVAFSVGGSIIILSGLILFPSYIVGVCRRHRSGTS
ncbi:monocarboxylate transporter 12-like [Pomacea canaliculata]|uniref:monocarboxylate transporter 12-like n=1 Tax=Pomacea canaliculata TaxID=400727 RepID=UPI000D72826D|nr:monocarboxylate transporter 12-like [Pomacea canaliculata]